MSKESSKTPTAYAKPLPRVDVYSKPFWQYAKKHELRMQQCKDCGKFRFPPSPVCDACLSENYDWKLLSGKGKIITWCVFHQLYLPGFKDEMPYNCIMVELQEGPLFISNLVGTKNEDIAFDMPVEVFFEDITPEFSLPKFRAIKK